MRILTYFVLDLFGSVSQEDGAGVVGCRHLGLGALENTIFTDEVIPLSYLEGREEGGVE